MFGRMYRFWSVHSSKKTRHFHPHVELVCAADFKGAKLSDSHDKFGIHMDRLQRKVRACSPTSEGVNDPSTKHCHSMRLVSYKRKATPKLRADSVNARSVGITTGAIAALAALTGRSPACSGLETCVCTSSTVDTSVCLYEERLATCPHCHKW